MTVFQYIKDFKPLKSWEYIIIHHSETKDGITINWNAIRNYHINVKKWDNVGYHFGIELAKNDKDIDELVYHRGRDLNTRGAHCLTRNQDSLGICLLGNYDKTEVSRNRYFWTACLCRALMRKYTIPIERVLPHWAFSKKTCPGKNFNMIVLRNYIIGQINS